jgi:hypothetical protein
MGFTPKQIGEMSLWQYQQCYKALLIKNGNTNVQSKPPSRKQLEATYKELGVWYPEMFEEAGE